MKAIVCTATGPPEVLQLKEVAKPTPKDNEVLVRVMRQQLQRGDCELRGLKIPSIVAAPHANRIWFQRTKEKDTRAGAGRRNRIGGQRGKIVQEGGPGLRAHRASPWRLRRVRLCLPEDGLIATKPANMTYEEAAAVPVGGLHAFHFLSKANIQSGQKVLIDGAGGSIGTFAVQIAKSFGAEVTGVDSTGKLDVVRSIGADHVIDYT